MVSEVGQAQHFLKAYLMLRKLGSRKERNTFFFQLNHSSGGLPGIDGIQYQ